MDRIDSTNEIERIEHDISDKFADLVCKEKAVAWDIETSGLDWCNNRIATCQLYLPNKVAAIVKITDKPPNNLRSLLSDPSVKKVFHHAMFDLRFMFYYWKALPQNVACTKIAAKLLDVKNKKKNNLQSILHQYLKVKISKKEQLSNWLSNDFTEAQISYAVNDVRYLLPLLETIENKLKSQGLITIAQACFAHIPTRVQLDVLGYTDVYLYN